MNKNEIQSLLRPVVDEALREVADKGWRQVDANVLILAGLGAALFNASEGLDSICKELVALKKTTYNFAWRVTGIVLAGLIGILIAVLL